MALNGALFSLIILFLIMSSYSSREYPELNLTWPVGPELEGHARDCWTALSGIKSCSNEIVAYFANRRIDINPPCCEAIAQITHQCWPDLLGAIGYGPDQTYILRGYCDAAAAFGLAPGPVGQPLPAVN